MRKLRRANYQRQQKWPGGEKIDLAFRGLELAGEVGELCNLLKKLIRVRKEIRGRLTDEQMGQKYLEGKLFEQICEELADVIICTDLLAMELQVDLVRAIPMKFNETSRKVGVDVLLGEDV